MSYMAEDSERHWSVVVTYSLTAPGSVTDAKVFEEFYAVPAMPPGWETSVTDVDLAREEDAAKP
jgi:hypothetical protein